MPVVKQCHSSHKQAEKSSCIASDVHVPPFGKPGLFAVWLLSGAPTLAHEDNRLAASGSYNTGARGILPPDLISLKLDITCYSDD